MGEVRIPSYRELFVGEDRRIAASWARFLHDMWQRTGGEGDVTLQAAGDDLTAIEALSGFGFPVRTATNTWTQRDIDAGNGITVADGDGISGNPTVASHIGVAAVQIFQVTVAFGDLGSGAEKTLLSSATGETWKVLDIWYDGTGTNFSGGGGDRLLDITDSTSTWTSISAAILAGISTNPARWGDSDLPNPGTDSHMFAASSASTNIVAKYSGGTADYTAGSIVFRLTAYRTA